MKISIAIMVLLLVISGKDLKIDFREAILYHDIKITLNGEEIHENQTLFLSSQPTWVVGVYYDGKWNKEVILRNGDYNRIRNTPYSVKLDGSIGLLIPDSDPIPDKIKEEKTSFEKKIWIVVLLAAAFFYYWYRQKPN